MKAEPIRKEQKKYIWELDPVYGETLEQSIRDKRSMLAHTKGDRTKLEMWLKDFVVKETYDKM